MYDDLKKALDSMCGEEVPTEDAGTSAGAKKGWYKRQAQGIGTPIPWKVLGRYLKTPTITTRSMASMRDEACDNQVAEDYGTPEGAIKAAQTRKNHGGLANKNPGETTTQIVQKGNSHILISPDGVAMGEYGNRKTAIKAANELGYLPGTVTQGGTTVMMRRDGVPTREMPHWNNHNMSLKDLHRPSRVMERYMREHAK